MTCLYYLEQAPTNFMARQIWINTVRVSWTSPPYSPTYLITTGDTRPTGSSAGIRVASGTYVQQQRPGTTKYWLVALYRTPIVVGPVSATVRGEEMCTYIACRHI